MAAVASTGKSKDVFDPWLSNKHWADQTLTFSFPSDGSSYSYMSTKAVTPLSASQQAAVRQALDEIAGFTGLSFIEVAETGASSGDLRFGTDPDESGAYAYLPQKHEQGGDAFFGPSTDNPQIGDEAYLYFTHEIGHAMGLNHGHDYPKFVKSQMDSQEFTVVTYTDYVGDTKTLSFDSGVVDWAQSYMQLDIAAMQFLYGANYASSGELWSGDTTYAFDPASGEMSVNGVAQGLPAGNRIFRTIWDGDGSDTYDLSNYGTDLEIDLRPGGWSVFSEAQLADLNRKSPDPAFDARGNVANALLVDDDTRALIENAIGGGGDDTILGNAAGNVLTGGGGGDLIRGKSGADVLRGDGGKDKLAGGRGADALDGGNGRDKLMGREGADTIEGGRGNDTLIGGAGRDVMTGGAGSDVFRFRSVGDSATGEGSDVIRDFETGADSLDLSGLADAALGLSIGGSFSGTGASVITVGVGSDTQVLVDVDGDANADFRVILERVANVVAEDFVL